MYLNLLRFILRRNVLILLSLFFGKVKLSHVSCPSSIKSNKVPTHFPDVTSGHNQSWPVLDQPPTSLLTNRLQLQLTSPARFQFRLPRLMTMSQLVTVRSFQNRKENQTKLRPDFSTLIKWTHIEGGLLCAQGKQSFSSEDTDEQDIELEDLDFWSIISASYRGCSFCQWW